MTYLITGANGQIGSGVVQCLLQLGLRPRLFVRDAAKARARFGDRVDIFVGDLADTKSLALALASVDALLLINVGQEIATRDSAAAETAKAAGVKHLVKLSSMDAQNNTGIGAWHAQGESAIRASGIPFTFVQPTGFMSNALAWAASIKAEGVVRAPTGDGRIPFIHPDDIIAVTTKALTTQKYLGEMLPISGPEALNHDEMTQKLGAAIGKPLRFEAISEEEEGKQMIESGNPPAIIEAHMSIYRAIREGRLAAVTHKVSCVIGREPIGFDQWAQENVAAFV